MAPKLDFDSIIIPSPEQRQPALEAALSAAPMPRPEHYVSDVPGDPGAPVWLANSRWGTGAAAGGPVATTLCPSCPRRVGDGCSGSVPRSVLYSDGGAPNPRFCCCPDFPRRQTT